MLLIHHGKVKSVYQYEGSEVMIEYCDKVTAGNGKKEDYPEGKGALCCTISAILFQKLEDAGDVIVHLMSSEAREFYDLESLWDPDL